MKDVKKEIKDIKVMLAQIMEAVVKQPSQASSENWKYALMDDSVIFMYVRLVIFINYNNFPLDFCLK